MLYTISRQINQWQTRQMDGEKEFNKNWKCKYCAKDDRCRRKSRDLFITTFLWAMFPSLPFLSLSARRSQLSGKLKFGMCLLNAMQCTAMPCHKYNGLFAALHRALSFPLPETHSLHFIPISSRFLLCLSSRWFLFFLSRLACKRFYIIFIRCTCLWMCVQIQHAKKAHENKARRTAREFIIWVNECAHFLSNRTNIQKPTSTTR